MQLLQHEQMWALSRAVQTELLQEAEKVRMLRKAHAPKLPWWANPFRRWQTQERNTLQPAATPELG